jgi:hypothetical protein
MNCVEAARRVEAGTASWEDSFLLVEYEIRIGGPVEQVIVWEDAFVAKSRYFELGGKNVGSN